MLKHGNANGVLTLHYSTDFMSQVQLVLNWECVNLNERF
jgi:hypothetical protein